MNDSFIECIIEAMQKEQNDTKIRTPLLTTLQKISLRRAGQLCMVKNGLVKWTLDTIKAEKDRLEGFSLDYIVALLLNLSLSK